MATIKIPQLGKIIDVGVDTVLFEILRKNDIPIASSCQGKQVCGRCAITVTKGIEHLNQTSEIEKKLAEKYNWDLESSSPTRAACIACFEKDGETVIKTTYW